MKWIILILLLWAVPGFADEEKETVIIIQAPDTRTLPDGYTAEDVSWLIDKALDGDSYEQRESLEELRDIIDEQLLEQVKE